MINRRTFLHYLAGASILGATGLGVTIISNRKEPETIDGKFYGMEGRLALTSLMDEVYYKKPNYVYVVGEYHIIHEGGLNEHTLQKIFYLIQKNKIDLVSLEGLEGKITAETLKDIEEDKRKAIKFNQMSENPEEYVVSGDTALSQNQIYFIIDGNRAFLGFSPGAYIAPALFGKVDAFGYEDMSLYQKLIEMKGYNELRRTKMKLENEEAGIQLGLAPEMPDKIFANREFLIDLINQQMELMRSKNSLLSEGKGRYNINKRMERIELNERSNIAVRNTTDYMNQNGDTSSILVAGKWHLPTIKAALKQIGFEPYKLIYYQ